MPLLKGKSQSHGIGDKWLSSYCSYNMPGGILSIRMILSVVAHTHNGSIWEVKSGGSEFIASSVTTQAEAPSLAINIQLLLIFFLLFTCNLLFHQWEGKITLVTFHNVLFKSNASSPWDWVTLSSTEHKWNTFNFKHGYPIPLLCPSGSPSGTKGLL